MRTPRKRHRPLRFTPPVLLASCCVVLIGLSLWSIRQEHMVAAYQARLDEEAAPLPAQPSLAVTDLPTGAPARVYLGEALFVAQMAATVSRDSDRAILLARADQYLRAIKDVRPHWGQYWIAKAYVHSLSSPQFSHEERDALIRSYLDAPYLHDAGRWRVLRGMAYWNAFPRFVQERIVKETVWLYKTSSGRNPQLYLLAARNSDAYLPVFMELRRSAR